jgi:hypothetical protein
MLAAEVGLHNVEILAESTAKRFVLEPVKSPFHTRSVGRTWSGTLIAREASSR